MLSLLTSLARRWRLFLLCLLIGIGSAAAITLSLTPTYRATTQLFVALSSGETALDLNQGATFSSQRVKSYPALVDSPLVLEPVISQLELDETPVSLARRVSAQVPVNTVLLEVTVDDVDSIRAAEIANAVAGELARVVQDLDRTSPTRESPVRVSSVRPATPPVTPRTPVPALNLSIGVLLGLLLGAGAVSLRETLDTTLRSESDVEEVTQRPALGAVPVNPSIATTPILSKGQADVVWAESYRKLRTNLSYLDPDNPPRSLMVTSALAGDGKTVTAANLAASLGQSGRRTVIVEADLRRPALGRLLGLVTDVGLTTAVAGRVPLLDLVQSCGDFDVVTAGPIPPNPSELLGSQAFRRCIEELLEHYDNVVIDTPPLIAVTDAAVVAATADTAIVVVKARRTSKQQLRRALLSLQAVDANVAGVVLNQVASVGGSYYRYDSTDGKTRKVRV